MLRWGLPHIARMDPPGKQLGRRGGGAAYQAEFYFLFPLLSTPSWPIILFYSPRIEISLVQMLQPGPGVQGEPNEEPCSHWVRVLSGQQGHTGGASTVDPPTWPPGQSWRGENPIPQHQEGGKHPFAPQSSSATPAAGPPVSELGCQPLPCLPWGLRGRLMRERRCRKHSTKPMAPGKCEASS